MLFYKTISLSEGFESVRFRTLSVRKRTLLGVYPVVLRRYQCNAGGREIYQTQKSQESKYR